MGQPAFFFDLAAPKLTLVVNRNSGMTAICNESGELIEIDGYSIHSASGSLSSSQWSSFADRGLGDWQEANPTATRLNELAPEGSLPLGVGANTSLGSPYQINAASLPDALGKDDLTFEYTTASGDVRNGIVEYTGYNNLVLFVDPLTGNAVLRNYSNFDVGLEAYSVASASGSLEPANGDWESLADQGAAGGGWQEANKTATRVSELKMNGVFEFQSGEQLELGKLFDPQSDQHDLEMEFLIAEGEEIIVGDVVYQIPGDFNLDGDVDAADYTVWRDSAGQTGVALAADGSGPTGAPDGVVDAFDFALWKSKFGAAWDANGAGASAAVPESSAALLAWIGLLVLSAACRRGW